jgi:glycosyltransferase involved in cell wall biosynthesis
LTPALAHDLDALVACLRQASPAVTVVLGGSLAAGTAGVRPDIDLFAILPTRRDVLRVLRTPALARALAELPLSADAEVVVLWADLVRRGRTAVCGRLLTGDGTLADAIARSPAPPSPNVVATAHVFLVESLLDPERAARLVAKAVVTGFRAWLRRRDHGWTSAALFSLASTRTALADTGAALDPPARALVDEALAQLAGARPPWESEDARGRAVGFLDRLGDGGRERLVRRWLRHAATRRRAGVWPFQAIDPTRAFVRAARAVVRAAAPTAAPGALATAASQVARLTGRCPHGPDAVQVHLLARALVAYGRDYPHKLLIPAAPPVPAPAAVLPRFAPTAAAAPAVVSLVIPCRDSADTLPGLLASIARQTPPEGWELETIVVDNGSRDDSAPVAAAGGAIVLHEPTPGASAARNTGMRRARGAVVIFLDADTRLCGRTFVHEILRALAAAPAAGLVGAAIECADGAGALGRADHMVCFFNWQATQPAEARHFHPSAALAATRAVLDATGGFDEALLSFHDFDFCRRARAQGFELYFEPAARVAHVPRRTWGTVVRHSFRWGWNSRRVYAPYDPAWRWWFLERPWLFALNVPFHVANRVWLTLKRWWWRRPLDTVTLAPVLAVLLCAWGAGVAAGGRRWILEKR